MLIKTDRVCIIPVGIHAETFDSALFGICDHLPEHQRGGAPVLMFGKDGNPLDVAVVFGKIGKKAANQLLI